MEKRIFENNDGLKNILNKFGKVIEDEKKSNLYVLVLDIKKVTENAILLRLSQVALMIDERDSETATLHLFSIYNKEQYKMNIMDIINRTNMNVEKGKFWIDDDGDVNWRATIEKRMVDDKALKRLFESMLNGMLLLAALVKNDEK